VIVLIENQPKNPLQDRLTIYNLTKELTLVSQSQVPKVYSICISAKTHHSGYHESDVSGDDENSSYHDNTYYTTIQQSPIGEIN